MGDLVESALAIVGVTNERVARWLHTTGGCGGCARRKEQLNQLGNWAKRVVAGKTLDAVRYLEGILNQ